ncbi:Major Facilitator Superfamily protein [Streptomyces sp. YIM 121038]|uniref:MFS transporter n=1 Tax=Streptomyces sp. YIM 121038 TaxID=2136401 RepID=UPI001110499A|nr:MFS transporter [Streptomyces sp. YIM 121038]QCX81712.1 Major Facilitator Superfamily protein [Streptomyces sp. YIM 121038]
MEPQTEADTPDRHGDVARPRPPQGPRAGADALSARDFRLFWWANAADALGTQASGVVLPLLLLALGHSAQTAGLVAGLSLAAGILLGPLAAVPADRGARKTIMFWSAAVSALALGSVALTLALGHLTLAHLLGAVLVERFATACHEAASRGTVALVCPPDEQPRAVARLAAADQGALILGPALGGAAYQLSRALPFLADAVSYAVAALCVRGMRTDLKAATEPSGDSLLREAAAGLRLVRRQPLLRLVLVWIALVNGVAVALYYAAVFALERSGTGALPLGVVLAVSGGAGLAGSLAAPKVAVRVGAARLVTAATWLLVPLTAALATATGPWAYGALLGAVCLVIPLAAVVLQARVLLVAEPAVQARVGAVLGTASGGAAALAPVLAGLFADRVDTAAPALCCAALLTVLAVHTTRRAALAEAAA